MLKLKPYSNSITIGKNVVNSFIDIVSKKDALYNKATISALDLGAQNITAFRQISDALVRGVSTPSTRTKFAKQTGWGVLMKTYHEYMLHQ